jgi:hypothetical protein
MKCHQKYKGEEGVRVCTDIDIGFDSMFSKREKSIFFYIDI